MVPNAAVKVGVSSNLTGVSNGSLHLEAPAGWRIEPEEIPVELRQRGDKKHFEFKVVPGSLKEGHTQIRAVLSAGGKNYSEGYTLVTREDLASAYYYQPAVQRVSIVDVKVPKDLKVAYIRAPATRFRPCCSRSELTSRDSGGKACRRRLAQLRNDRSRHPRLRHAEGCRGQQQEAAGLRFGGGTLIVQYNASAGDFNSGHFTPFPAQLSRARVSVEEAPVEILAPDDSVFHYPNQITQHDFDGWVQERGLYFMDQWDNNFKPLLSSHDPGEPPLKGGLLRASTARAHTSTPDTLFSANCPRACRERFGCM